MELRPKFNLSYQELCTGKQGHGVLYFLPNVRLDKLRHPDSFKQRNKLKITEGYFFPIRC